MTDLEGKGFFGWQIRNLGNIDVLADTLVAQGYTHFHVKIANAADPYNVVNGVDLLPSFVAKLKARGLKVWGWHYIYLDNPAGEANRAISRIQESGVDGYAIDAEGEAKGKYSQASTFTSTLRVGLPANVPVALCSYRFPRYHQTLPWDILLSVCDYHMPQMYWVGAHNPAIQLRDSAAELLALRNLPIIPVGSAYKEGDWWATAEDVVEFMDAARTMNMKAVAFWEWAHTSRYLPLTLNAIHAYNWPVTNPPEPPEPPEPPSDITHEDILKAIAGLSDQQGTEFQGINKKLDAIITKLGETPPGPTEPPANLGTYRVVQGEKANGHWQVGVNAKGKPILGLPPVGERLQWAEGQTVQVYLPDVDVDGSVKFWEVYGKTYTGNKFNNNKVYLKEGDGELI